MTVTSINFSKYISFAVMLLMFVALAAGQAVATSDIDNDKVDESVAISVEIAADPDHFRSEDE